VEERKASEMIVERGRGRDIIVRGRTPEGERYQKSITGYWPYCFVRDEDAEFIDCVRQESGYTGLYGESLTKIVCATTKDVSDIGYAGQTWEANIPYVNRVLADYINDGNEKIPNYRHRTWYLDAEWSPVTGKIRVIVVYDNFSEREFVWFLEPDLGDGNSKPYNKYGEYSYNTPAIGFGDEKSLLTHFIKHMNKQDPDIIAGWYVTGADIKQFFDRCRVCGIPASSMSPLRQARYDFGDWDQPIVGRNCIDLMLAVSKLWELKNGKLPSYKLGDVGEEIVGETKVELPDGHDTWDTDKALYIHYCRQDVRLLPRLDEAVNALDYFIALQHLVQCDIRSTPFITKMFSNLVLTDPGFDRRIPTRPQFDKINYEGADVLDVEPGVYDNVGILDIKAMYHSNANKYNISWDTLSPDGEDCGNGTKFRTDTKGVLIRQMDYMTKMRNEFKALMKSDPENIKKWDTMQFAAKTLVASMYGVAGDAKYGMYHPEIAAAITYTSRSTLHELMDEAEAEGFNVLYGHTDSVFCVIPTPERGLEVIDRINARMAPIEVEFEKWCSRIILVAKNRYTGMTAWTDGSYHDPTLYVKGIELKQSRMPPVMKEAMTNTITGILNGDPSDKVTTELSDLITNVVGGNVDPALLCMKGKLVKDLSQYKVLSGPSAGAGWANEFLGKGYRAGDFFLVTIDEKGNYLAFDDPSEIDGIATIGYSKLADRFILKKVEPYFNLAGWPTQPLINAHRGLGNLTWV
jgi:DNA polymerase elongation subunit (family B)